MTKLIMLGTGHGAVMELYNTCFVIQNEEGSFLVDTGGSIEIVKRLNDANVNFEDIKGIFISHTHCDHLLGMVWIFKKFAKKIMENGLNVYCNDVVYDALKKVAYCTAPASLMDKLYEKINFMVLNDGDKHVISGVEYEFFDILAKGIKQFGFEGNLDNKKFVFLGDETFNPSIENRVLNADYVAHEAFCLDSEESIFKAYEKNHSTALSAAKKMNEYSVKNLILYHTEETHGKGKCQLYKAEASSVFDGNVLVPYDMDEIII